LAVIDAAGFEPFRVLPLGEPPDGAGRLLHENLCPHVKVVLDRALAGDLPPLEGMVFLTSCDAMRRLADVWQTAVPGARVHLVDLPTEVTEGSIRYFAGELRRLAAVLRGWGGLEVTADDLRRRVARRDELARLFEALRGRRAEGGLRGGSARLQQLVNEACTTPLGRALDLGRAVLNEPAVEERLKGVPVYLFGNVMPDPESLALLETCGAQVVEDDLCTGSRWMARASLRDDEDPFEGLARAVMTRSLCARTVTPTEPGRLAHEVARRALACGARGVVCHTVKFCDPYLARLPGVRAALAAEGLRLLVLESDCTMRSLGQSRTRIEAFVEMLG
jgi:benzoyl-CoA reductase/2-hydroxyglutaryl-CoA dehydratase subunit BcrC/BadD/HgdB